MNGFFHESANVDNGPETMNIEIAENYQIYLLEWIGWLSIYWSGHLPENESEKKHQN